MNLVLFLGAGFSKPFGLPVMAEFYDFALGEKSPLDGEQREFIRSLRKLVRNTASMMSVDENNLEDLLSVSLMADDMWPGGTNTRLLACLWKIYRSLDTVQCERLYGNALKRLVGFEKIDSHHHTVITTNYDLVAECGFLTMGCPLGLPGEWKASTGHKDSHDLYNPRGSSRIICKLHGSVNWALNTQVPDLLHVDGRLGPPKSYDPVVKKGLWSQPLISIDHYAVPDAPLIVAPTLYKANYPLCFNQILKAARAALRNADRVAFVGYSFPPSDTFMKYFLACSLVDSCDLRSIDIVDINADRIVNQLRSEPERFGPTFRQKLRAFNGRWEKGDYNIIDS